MASEAVTSPPARSLTLVVRGPTWLRSKEWPDGLHALLIVLAAAVAAMASDEQDWHSLPLIASLVGLSALTYFATVPVSGVRYRSSTLPAVIAFVLLGPLPGLLVALASQTVDLVTKTPRDIKIGNLSVMAVAGSLTGLLAMAMGGVGSPALAALASSVSMDLATFVIVAVSTPVFAGRGLRSLLVELFLPVLPWTIASAGLAAAAVSGYEDHGLAAIVALGVLMAASQGAARAIAREFGRVEEMQRLAAERDALTVRAREAGRAERDRIAAQMHDDALQLLAVARQDLNELPHGELRRACESIAGAEERIRSVLTSPASSAELEQTAQLVDGLRALLAEVTGASAQAHVTREVASLEDETLSDVLRELVMNIVKHSAASNVIIRVSMNDGKLVAVVSDDGRGFDPSERAEAGHFGLALARRRVAARGGALSITSRRGHGTRAVVKLPLAG